MALKLEVYAAHTHVEEKELRNKTAVVIDTLRATSTIITALHNGCEQVLPVAEVDDAMEMRANMTDINVVLGGERNTEKVAGFDYGNSPLEYTPEAVQSKTLILTTTNGTLAVHRALEAKALYIGALINGMTVAKTLLRQKGDAVLLCAGTKCRFSMEDILTAGHIIYRMQKLQPETKLKLDDLGQVALDLYTTHKDNLLGTLRGTTHYNILLEHGMQNDLEYCLKRDIIDKIPKFHDGVITL